MKTRKMDLDKIVAVIDPIVAMRKDNWYLVSAMNKEGKTNALTAAWGALGNVCEKKTAIVYIRPQRYTKRFMDESGRFTMTYFDFEKYGKALGYMGSHSGEHEPDKIQNSGLHLVKVDGQPTYEEGKYVLICKIFFHQQLGPENFADESIRDSNFPDQDYSVMYIAEIENAYEILGE